MNLQGRDFEADGLAKFVGNPGGLYVKDPSHHIAVPLLGSDSGT